MTRLRTDIMVAAALRQAEGAGIYAAVLRRGDAAAGTVFVEIERNARQACLLARQLSFDGDYEWVQITGDGWVSTLDVTQALTREAARDPDCWIISVQDAKGRNIFALDGAGSD